MIATLTTLEFRRATVHLRRQGNRGTSIRRGNKTFKVDISNLNIQHVKS
jgi:hypothetical protein